MMLPEIENLAQIAIARILNSLPEGIVIAALAWLMLRLLPRQNSRTRFAVWFVALGTVASLPVIAAFSRTTSFVASGTTPSLFTFSNHWAFILFSLWVLGVCAAAAHLLMGILRLRALRASCKIIDPGDLNPALAEIAREFLSSRSVVLATSERLGVPAAIGFFRPLIVFPEWALHEFTPEEFKVILLHEFAHLSRRDDWTNLLQKAVRALFIFHPAVWWIERQLSREREMACDDHVLAETDNPRGYAKCLLTLLERSLARRAWTMAQAAVHRADEARERLVRILDTKRLGSRRFGKPAIGLAGVVSVLCLAIVPHAPELVAFTPSARDGNALSTPGFENSQSAGASVIPASLHVRTSQSSVESTPMNQHPVVARAIAAKAKSAPIGPRIVKAKATRRAISAQTLLVIRTTERIGPDAWISRVTVWRLTYVPARTEKVPVAKTT